MGLFNLHPDLLSPEEMIAVRKDELFINSRVLFMFTYGGRHVTNPEVKAYAGSVRTERTNTFIGSLNK